MKFLIGTLICLFTVIILPRVYAQHIVVHPEVQEEKISRNTLRAIFSMRLRKWSNGTPITVFVLSDDSPLHIQFSKHVLHIFPYQLRRAWDRQVFSGTGQSPQEVQSLEEMQDMIAVTPGAIGYLQGGEPYEGLGVLRIR